jgi:hypothetical protein
LLAGVAPASTNAFWPPVKIISGLVRVFEHVGKAAYKLELPPDARCTQYFMFLSLRPSHQITHRFMTDCQSFCILRNTKWNQSKF